MSEVRVGDPIFLPYGRQAIVTGVFPRMNVARIRTIEGEVRTVKLSDIRKPEVVSTVLRARPLSQQTPLVSDRVAPQAEKKIAGDAKPVARRQVAQIGKKEPETGRTIVQPANSIIQNERLAAQAAPHLETMLSRISAQIPGTKFDRLRPQKNPDRVIEKVEEGKPPQTISDYLAAQISADSVPAKDRLIASLRKEFKVVNVDDKFLKGRRDKAGYPSANVQVQLPDGNTAEVQIVPREVQEITDSSHHFYKLGRDARDAGHASAARSYFDQAQHINREAIERFKERQQSTASRDKLAIGRQHSARGAAELRSRSFTRPDHVIQDDRLRGRDHQARPSFSKGEQVTLMNGQHVIVQYVSPTMNIVRVRTLGGKTRTVRVGEIRKAAISN